jgi:hypothetical protein
MNKNMKLQNRTHFLIALTTMALSLNMMSSCRPVAEEAVVSFDVNTELAQQLGDVMTSIDESAGSSGNYASIHHEIKAAHQSIARFSPQSEPSKFNRQLNLFASALPQAVAASCFGSGFSTCSAGVITRNFSQCTVGSSTFAGSVTLNFSGPTVGTCKLSSATDTVKRNPNFTITNSVGSIAVSKTGTDGQVMTYTSGAGTNKVFSLTNDGIRRVITVGTEIKHNVVTSITSAVTVTGSDRASRIMNGGSIRLQNALTFERCDIAPSAVTWSGTCSCATSGSWSGSCETKGAFILAITGCGTANLTVGAETKAVTLSQCSGS